MVSNDENSAIARVFGVKHFGVFVTCNFNSSAQRKAAWNTAQSTLPVQKIYREVITCSIWSSSMSIDLPTPGITLLRTFYLEGNAKHLKRIQRLDTALRDLNRSSVFIDTHCLRWKFAHSRHTYSLKSQGANCLFPLAHSPSPQIPRLLGHTFNTALPRFPYQRQELRFTSLKGETGCLPIKLRRSCVAPLARIAWFFIYSIQDKLTIYIQSLLIGRMV